MKREFTMMSQDEVYEWTQARRADAIAAFMAARIDQWVLDELLDALEEGYTDYLFAASLGLIPPHVVAGEGGRTNEC